MAKMTKARKRQLNRVRRLRKSLADRGYILPAVSWDLTSLSTQKLASMTPDWFYRKSEYKVKAGDYASLINTFQEEYFNIKPGDVVSGRMGRWIERRRSMIKSDYSYTGRAWQIIREKQLQYTRPEDAIGANQAANELTKAISERGIDIVEAHIKEMPEEFFRRLDELIAADYESLSEQSNLIGLYIVDILELLASYLREILESW